MKLFISVDMEGMPGISNFSQQTLDRSEFRSSIYNYVKWLVESIQKTSRNLEVEVITICDSHASGTNLLYSEVSLLDNRINLISGTHRDQFMMATLDSSYSHVFLIGYHAGHGGLGYKNGNMGHTFSSKTIHRMFINDIIVNETIVNSIFAKDIGVPVVLVTGDDILKEQLIDAGMIPTIQYVTNKISLSPDSVCCQSPAKIKKDLKEAVENSLDKTKSLCPTLTQFKPPYSLKIEFNKPLMAYVTAQIPNVKQIDNYSINYICDNSEILLNCISTFARVASTVE